MTMLDILDPHDLFSGSKSEAAELTAKAVGAGDLDKARFWAAEFAIHQDAELTRAELGSYRLSKIMPT